MTNDNDNMWDSYDDEEEIPRARAVRSMSPLSPTVVTSEETASGNIDRRYADNEEHESESVEKRKKKTKAFIWKDDMIFFLLTRGSRSQFVSIPKTPAIATREHEERPWKEFTIVC